MKLAKENMKIINKIEICLILVKEGTLIQAEIAEKIGDIKSHYSKSHCLLNELHKRNLVHAPKAKQGKNRECTLAEQGKEFVKKIKELL